MFREKDLKSENCDRRRFVKDFCFPDGIEVLLAKKQGLSPDQVKISAGIERILYSSNSDREQVFIFTMNANEDKMISLSSETESPSSEIMETFPGVS
jgi:hypothetical protein